MILQLDAGNYVRRSTGRLFQWVTRGEQINEKDRVFGRGCIKV